MFLHSGSLLSTPIASFPSGCGHPVAWCTLQKTVVWLCLCCIPVVAARLSAEAPPVNFFLLPTATSSTCILPLGPFSLLLGSVAGPAVGSPCAAHFVRRNSI